MLNIQTLQCHAPLDACSLTLQAFVIFTTCHVSELSSTISSHSNRYTSLTALFTGRAFILFLLKSRLVFLHFPTLSPLRIFACFMLCIPTRHMYPTMLLINSKISSDRLRSPLPPPFLMFLFLHSHCTGMWSYEIGVKPPQTRTFRLDSIVSTHT